VCKLKRVLLVFLAFAAVVIALAGCGGGSSSHSPRDGTWTVMVYMNADNDLERFGIENLNQMEKVGSTDKVKIVVQVDRIPGYDSSNGDWTGCRRYLITKDSDTSTIKSQLVQDMGEVDMGDWRTLSSFIQWAQTNYPADHYCLVIWNHGNGWRSRATKPIITRDVSFDDTSGTSIKTADLPYALSAASPKLDIVAFDACYMQMLEVAYEIRSCADIMVGSEGSPPGDGYVYNTWLSDLVADPGMTPAELGTAIAKRYIESYTGIYDVNQSVLDLARIDSVASAANGFAAVVIPHADSSAAELRLARENAQSYDQYDYKDLRDYAAKVANALSDQAVTSAYDALTAAISAAVIYNGHTGSSVVRSYGISIYVPAPYDYQSSYDLLEFSKDYPSWAAWLKAQKQ